LLIVGFGLEIATGSKGLEPLHFPYNLILLIVIVNVCIVMWWLFPKTAVVQWLSSVPVALTSIGLILILTMTMGAILQDDEHPIGIVKLLGLSHMTNHWAFLIAMLFMLLNLGIVTLKRATVLSIRNIGFLVNHFGLWLTISTATLGAGDLKRLQMTLNEGEGFTNLATDVYGMPYNMDLGLNLLDFKIENFAPKLAILNTQNMELSADKQKIIFEIEKGKSGKVKDWNIEVLEYIPSAMWDSVRGYFSSPLSGAYPVAKIKVFGGNLSKPIEDWTTCGSYIFNYKYISISDTLALVMTVPEAKKFSSKVAFVTKEGKNDTTTIEVNNAFQLNGWKIYQTGYDEKKGQWSTTSIFEIVKDPWLPIVYFGIFLMLAGGIFIFWQGRSA